MSTTQPNQEQPAGRQPLAPAKRRRLQMCFEQGTKVAAAGQFDYATDMYTMCVTGDPANPIYVKSFLSNLAKKYDNNKKGSKLAGMKTVGAKTAIKKASLQKDWNTVITTGLEILKLNPWDTGALVEISRACEALDFEECQLEYMRMALDADLADPEINRAAGKAFARVGQFDEAISCWQRVIKSKPGDEEGMRAIHDLSVEKTIKRGGYEDAQNTKDVRAHKTAAASDDDKRLTPEQQLERAIKKNPADVNNYVELSDLHLREERYEKAEEILTTALQASGGDMNIRERLEETQLRRARQQLAIAEKRAREDQTDAAKKLYQDLKSDLNQKEIQVYTTRCERHPANVGYKYELAVRLEKAKKFAEAIKLYQGATSDLKRRGLVYMGLGRSFTQIKQYKLALANFEKAVEHIPEREADQRKEALYLAGKLAVHVKDVEAADKYLSTLAGLDFGYKDVSEWLDKLAQLREDGPTPMDD